MSSAIQEALWNGTIPISFTYKGQAFLKLVPRNSFLPPYMDEVLQYFHINYKNDEENDSNDIVSTEGVGKQQVNYYLLYDEVPLQWQLPVGILYDMSYKEGTTTWNLALITQEEVESALPRGTIENNSLKSFPLKDFHKYSINQETFKEVITNLIKQLSFVLSSTSKLVMSLNPSRSEQLWQAIIKHNWLDYELITKEIIPKTLSRIPVKLFVIGSPVMIQLPIEANEGLLLLDVIKKSVSEVELTKVIIHGIDFDQELQAASISKVWELFKYVDNYLYIIVEKA